MPEMRKILRVRVSRSCEEGLIIFIQSSLNWSVFAKHPNNDEYEFQLGGVKCYVPKEMRLENVLGQFYTENVWEFDDYPNLSLLLAKGIKEGVTFNFGILAVSDEKIAAFINNLKLQAKMLYFTYLKPVDVEASFTTEIVEKVVSV